MRTSVGGNPSTRGGHTCDVTRVVVGYHIKTDPVHFAMVLWSSPFHFNRGTVLKHQRLVVIGSLWWVPSGDSFLVTGSLRRCQRGGGCALDVKTVILWIEANNLWLNSGNA